VLHYHIIVKTAHFLNRLTMPKKTGPPVNRSLTATYFLSHGVIRRSLKIAFSSVTDEFRWKQSRLGPWSEPFTTQHVELNRTWVSLEAVQVRLHGCERLTW